MYPLPERFGYVFSNSKDETKERREVVRQREWCRTGGVTGRAFITGAGLLPIRFEDGYYHTQASLARAPHRPLTRKRKRGGPGRQDLRPSQNRVRLCCRRLSWSTQLQYGLSWLRLDGNFHASTFGRLPPMPPTMPAPVPKLSIHSTTPNRMRRLLACSSLVGAPLSAGPDVFPRPGKKKKGAFVLWLHVAAPSPWGIPETAQASALSASVAVACVLLRQTLETRNPVGCDRVEIGLEPAQGHRESPVGHASRRS